MPEPTATASTEIAADPATVYALISDLDTMAQLAEETAAMRWAGGANSAAPGAKFKGTNRNGWHRWTTTCTVTDAEPGRRFAFDVKYAVIPVSHWQYDIEPTATGCRVTESTHDQRPGWFKGILSRVGTGVKNRDTANGEHIEATLRRLKERAEK